jgi:hypothetical protein
VATAPPENARRITWSSFAAAAKRQGLSDETAAAIWAELGTADAGSGLAREQERFAEATGLSRTVKVLLYLGAFLVIGSYGWWASSIEFDVGGLLALSLVYATAFLATALYARSRGFEDLGAAAAVVVAFYAPVIAYAALELSGFDFEGDEGDVAAFYEWISGGWVWMELFALAAGIGLYVLFRVPLLGLPISLFAMFLAMDGTARLVSGNLDDASHEEIGAVVLSYGVLWIGAGIFLDYRGLRRHAFWPHLFGAAGVLWGLGALCYDWSTQGAVIASGAVFLALGAWLGRVGYLAAGALAIWCGITALEPSPWTITVSGLLAIGVAVWLSLADSPLRRWLEHRTLPAPQRD